MLEIIAFLSTIFLLKIYFLNCETKLWLVFENISWYYNSVIDKPYTSKEV